MFTIRRFWGLLVYAMAFITPLGNAQAQQNTIVSLTIIQGENTPTSAHTNLLNEFTSLLNENDIAFKIGSANEQNPEIELRLLQNKNASFLEVNILQTQYTSPSPLIETIQNQPQIFLLSEQNDVAIQTLLSYSYYATDNCAALLEFNSMSNFYTATCLLQDRNYEQAIEIYQQDTQTLESAMNIAWAYIQLENPEEASAAINQPIESIAEDDMFYSVAHHVHALSNAASIHALIFDFDTAIEQITMAVELAEANNLPHKVIAQLYKQRGDHIFLIYEWDRVLADYDRAIELNPTYADAYYARGVLYYTQGPRTAALEDFEQFAALAPQDERIPEAQTYINSIKVELEALGGDDTSSFPPGG